MATSVGELTYTLNTQIISSLANNEQSLFSFEQRTHSEYAYKFSQRATLAAGWWFYDVFVQKIFQLILPPGFFPNDKKAVAIKIIDTFQDQIKKNGSDARIKMFGDIPFATPWWSWLFR